MPRKAHYVSGNHPSALAAARFLRTRSDVCAWTPTSFILMNLNKTTATCFIEEESHRRSLRQFGQKISEIVQRVAHCPKLSRLFRLHALWPKHCCRSLKQRAVLGPPPEVFHDTSHRGSRYRGSPLCVCIIGK